MTTTQRVRLDAGPFFVPAIALAVAALVLAIAAIPNSFEASVATLGASIPTVAALVLGHLTLARDGQAQTLRWATLGGLGLAYVALLLVVISAIT